MKSLLDKVKQVYHSIIGTSTNTIGTMTTGTSTGTLTVNNPNYYGMGGNVGIGTTSTYSTWNTDDVNTATRKLKRRLWAIQHNKTWTHEMDDNMFESVCSMLQSEIKADNEVAKEIIFNSKMCLKYRKHFVSNFRYKLEPSKFEKMGFNNITGGYYTTSINSGYYSTGTITTSTGTGLINAVTTSGTTLVAKKAAK
jgi:hypothetical protein